MALKHLEKDVQSILSASSHVNTFKTAIEELIYNSLDAESKSIAIRIDIQEYKMQVVDNGQGILKTDFQSLGHKHMTSKSVDLATLKSGDKSYGYKGDFLANAVAVSHTVQITSRHKDAEETWEKTFIKGKEKMLIQVAKRPSQGTTVEIKGYLYNLNIQRKAIDNLTEITNIKQFLEHLSIVQNDISLSLRDDSKNEIIFSIHKKRDIYQTLSNLFNINKSNIQELQVQKNNYEVKALIGLNGKECNQKLIYLNGKPLVDNSKLHDIVNDAFQSYLRVKDNRLQKSKLKTYATIKHAEATIGTNTPFYFLFIFCPRNDYDISNTGKYSVLEFKNWEHITMLLQKLVKFYAGEANSKVVTKAQFSYNKKANDSFRQNTRNQVKVIMDKILGKQSRKNFSAYVKNGVKGKLIRRKLQSMPNNENQEKLKPKNKNNSHRMLLLKENKTRDSERQSHTKNNLSYNGVNGNTDRNIKLCNNVNNKRKCEQEPSDHYNILESITNYHPSKIKKRDKSKTSASIQKCSKNKFKKQYSVLENSAKLLSVRNENKIFDDNEFHNSPNNFRKRPNYFSMFLKSNEKYFRTTYDLVQTIIRSQKDTQSFENINENNLRHKLFQPKPNFTSSYNVNLSFGTFQSHFHEKTQFSLEHKNRTHKRFITEKSKDNFKEPINLAANIRYESKPTNLQQQINRYYDINLKQTIEESYTIEFTKSNDNKYKDLGSKVLTRSNERNKEVSTNTKDNISIIKDDVSNCVIDDKFKELNIDTADTQDDACSLIMSNERLIQKSQEQFFGSTYTVPQKSAMRRLDQSNKVDSPDEHNLCRSKCPASHSINDIFSNDNNFNVLFVSYSENKNIDLLNSHYKEPIEICEAVLDNNQSIKIGHENCHAYNNNQMEVHNENVANNLNEQHYLLGSANEIPDFTSVTCSKFFVQKQIELINHNTPTKVKNNTNSPRTKEDPHVFSNDFSIKDRLTFLPKGMSQIFEICQSKSACDYNLDKDYFKNSIYTNFANDVEFNTGIYEPLIKNVKDFTTKNIDKVIDKQKKDNASLIFNGISLKESKVLGQVDQKFIVAIMKEVPNELNDGVEYLILFDQHAVHERIRLENNLADYLNKDQWKSMPIENIRMNMTKEEILYLHNYSEKFTQLGLQWNANNDSDVSFNAIPEAILGKRPREVDKVMIAIRNLIAEEVQMLKNQKGCISMYPKTIMDLVFSEACRYAIKFGDKLSKNECSELVQSLSKCKVPFQCAHGRPVMAVLMDIQLSVKPYKVDFSKLKQFTTRKLE